MAVSQMSHESRLTLAKSASEILTAFSCSGSNCCVACSEKLRLIISSIFKASTLSKLRIMLYVSLNWERSLDGSPSIIFCRSLAGGASSPPGGTMITEPTVSRPRRPARPAIWVYSPGSKFLKECPSCFLYPENTTVLVGRFNPIAKVSVAKRTLTKVWAKRISTSSLTIGRRPPWCTAMPLPKSSRSLMICGKTLSSGLSLAMDFSMII